MKSYPFFKTFLACLLAIVVGGLVTTILFALFIVGIVSSLGSRPETGYRPRAHTILKLDLSVPVVDNASNDPLDYFDPYGGMLGLNDQRQDLLGAVAAIERAENDPHIDGIYLSAPPSSGTSAEALYELRQALELFRERSGKFIVAYSDNYSQGGYYLASCADRVLLNPQGGMDWRGLSVSVMFYKGLFDKLGIEPELIRHGAFKSAGEPFIQKSLSPENRTQLEQMTATLWNTITDAIAASRSLSADSLKAWASGLSVVTPGDALARGLVDSLMYRDQLATLLSQLTAQETDKEPLLVSLAEYNSGLHGLIGNPSSANQIALVYAQGDILDEGNGKREIVGNKLAATLRSLRRDPAVKAVVLRVNSPGGSALASECIWREVDEMSRSGKPIVVSMGDYAASGGYYMSCAADRIIAGPATLTGSIGVFSLMFNAEAGAREKLGITTETVRTGTSADIGNMLRGITPAERTFMQRQVDSVYARFVAVVADGRNLGRDSVERLAGGRIWTGRDACVRGLADKEGTLRDAIFEAQSLAGLAPGDFLVKTYPEREASPLGALLHMLGVTSVEASTAPVVPEALTDAASAFEGLKRRSGNVQAAMPFDLLFSLD